jgi:hypothetical protein
MTYEELRAMLPKKKGKPEEHLQAAIVRYYRLQYPERYGMLFSNHNNANSAAQGEKAKAQGRVAGVADLTYLNGNGNIVFIECKTPTGKQSQEQKQWQKLIEENGYRYEIVRSIEDAKKIFEE